MVILTNSQRLSVYQHESEKLLGVPVLWGTHTFFGFYSQEPHQILMGQIPEKSSQGFDRRRRRVIIVKYGHRVLGNNGLLPQENILVDYKLHDSNYKTFWKDKTIAVHIYSGIYIAMISSCQVLEGDTRVEQVKHRAISRVVKLFCMIG